MCLCDASRRPACKKDVIYPNDLAERYIASITGQHTVDRQLDAYLANAGVTVERYMSSYFFAIARNIIAAGNKIFIVDPANGKANLNDGVT